MDGAWYFIIFIIIVIIVVVIYVVSIRSTLPFGTITPGNQFIPIVIPDNLPNEIIDCNFFGTKVANTAPCPVGSDFLDPSHGNGTGCFSRPCPPGFVRVHQCACVKM